MSDPRAEVEKRRRKGILKEEPRDEKPCVRYFSRTKGRKK